MRICHLNPFYFPYAGGIERRIRATAKRLAPAHDVHVVTAQLPGTEAGTQEEDGYVVHRLASRFPLKSLYNPPPVTTPGLAQTLAEIDPDVVDYHFRWSASYNRAARTLSRAGLVVTYHNTYGEGRGALGMLSRLNDRAFMPTVRRADRVVAVSRFVADQLTRRGVDAKKVHVGYNGIDTHEVAAVEGPPALRIDAPIIVGVGRLVRLKGFDLLLRALAHMRTKAHLVILGRGPEQAALARLAARLGVGERVHLPGWVDEDEKIRIVKAAVALAHPAHFEAFGLGVLEALACGTPVVASRVGGLPEVVGDAGVLLGRDAAEWAHELDALVEDPRRRDDLAAKARRQAATMDWGPLTHDLERVYREAVHA